jgi:hypothetical protein
MNRTNAYICGVEVGKDVEETRWRRKTTGKNSALVLFYKSIVDLYDKRRKSCHC